MSEVLQVTSVEDLKKISSGSIIELPPFGDGQRFIARVKRPSLLKLMRDGKIPNSLATKANELFAGKATLKKDDPEALKDLFKLLDIFASACLVEPSKAILDECGIELTDEQLLALFEYSQRGMKALEKFRRVEANPAASKHGETLQENTERDNEN